MSTVKVIHTSSYLPIHEIKNADWELQLDTTDEWIRKRTGIQSRRYARELTTSDLAIKAAQKLLEESKIHPDEIEFVIVATMTPDTMSPSCAAKVQGAIGATNAFAFDISAACAGFVFALSTGVKMLSAGNRKYGLVIGAETMLSVLDWKDRSTAILFGDGAGAVLLEKTDQTTLFVESLRSDGLKGDALVCGERMEQHTLSTMKMDGRGVFELVSREVPKNISETLEKAHMSADEVDLYILHQANVRLIEQVAKKLKQPIDKFPTNLERVGNTSAASVPILLDELVQNQLITFGSGQKLLLSGFGGGLSWGSIIITI